MTVVMPAMNRAHLIGRALDSVRAQTLRPREVVVVDDASTDDTVAVARAHGATVLEMETNGGSGPARNRGIEAASTTWIAFLDSDDSWHPDHLRTLMDRAGDHVLVGSPGRSTDGRVLGNSSSREVELTPLTVLSPGDMLCTSGTAARRDALLAAGLFRDLRRAQDLDMWVRVLERGTGLALARPTVTYHLHEQQAILDSDLMRQCFTRIVDDCRSKDWFTDRDADRAWVRWHWDDARAAQRSGEAAAAVRELSWFASRPYTWSTLAALLRARRLSRNASA
ncbi:glycosyltransferase family 2 protein [Kineococcus terrestris]|uniref:glycosyltransferase family 2 protein n=1 Tax=Kineococcus terrestris TaxID=2044856 RepID=UPI0034DAEEA9